MGEVIHIREILRRRDIAKGHARDRENLRRAVEILKQNLHATTDQIVGACASEQLELLDQAEKFIAMIRYGMRMLGESAYPEPLLYFDRK
jgi:hypothetical protein